MSPGERAEPKGVRQKETGNRGKERRKDRQKEEETEVIEREGEIPN